MSSSSSSSSTSASSVASAAGAAFQPVQQQPQEPQMADNIPAAEEAVQLVPAVAAVATSEQLCYVHCHFCDTVLVVSVPTSSLFKTVTVRCGHCSSLLTVNMTGVLFPSTPTSAAATATAPPPPTSAAAAAGQHGGQLHYFPHSSLNLAPNPPHHSLLDEISSANPSLLLEQHGLGGMMASAGSRNAPAPPPEQPPAPGKGAKEPSPRTNTVMNRPLEKRQRVPSAYNRFIKDEIQRIKAGNPDISHREAFSAAAKNWAHFPHIHFGLMPDHQGLNKASLLPPHQDHQRKDRLLKDGLYAAAAAAAAAAANMGVAPY